MLPLSFKEFVAAIKQEDNLSKAYNQYVSTSSFPYVLEFLQAQDGDPYIQVAASVRNEQTLQRELRPLKAVKDNCPKMILTLDDDTPGDYNGITRMNALDWLMGD